MTGKIRINRKLRTESDNLEERNAKGSLKFDRSLSRRLITGLVLSRNFRTTPKIYFSLTAFSVAALASDRNATGGGVVKISFSIGRQPQKI